MKRVVIEENKEWIFRSEANKSLSYLIDSKEQETTDDLSWNEISYSVMIKLDSKLSTIYTIRYDTLFECFSFFGGLSSCISFFSVIKTIISSHFADLFMLNFNFINTKNDERRSRKFSGELGLNDTQGKQISIMKESDLEENELNTNSRYKMNIRKEEENNDKFNNSVGMSLVSDRMFRETLNSTEEPRKQQQILTYGTYLKYKIFKCCVKNQKKLYTNYKWM